MRKDNDIRKKMTGAGTPLLCLTVMLLLLVSGCSVKEAQPDVSGGAEEAARPEISAGIQVAAGEPVLLDGQDGDRRILYADLTHDGKDEQIVLEVKTGEADFTEADVTVLTEGADGSLSPIYEKHMDQSHTGWGWLYLYEEDGAAYLLDYDPVLYEGTSRYSFTVFSLTETGETETLRHDELNFEWTGAQDTELESRIREFNEKAFACMDQAEVIAAIGDEYFSGIRACDFAEGTVR